jgi:hypothetical protein
MMIRSSVDNNRVNDVSTSYKSSAGGGIFNWGNGSSFTIVSSCLSNNIVCPVSIGETVYGGGIYNLTTLILINSTVSGNRALAGGATAPGYTGGIVNVGILTLKNCTVAGNAGGTSVGGILNDGTLNLSNTIIGDNQGPYYDDLLNRGSVIQAGMNIVEDFNLTGPNVINEDPCLGALQDNGGLTKTHLLLEKSPAIDAAGNNELPADTWDMDEDSNISESIPWDQRGEGFPRISNQIVDIGAVEFIVAEDSCDYDDDDDVDGIDLHAYSAGLIQRELDDFSLEFGKNNTEVPE